MVSMQICIDYLNQKSCSIISEKTFDESKYTIFIEVEDNKLYLLKEGECIKEYPVGTGKKESPSPIGYWKIIYKSKWGEGFGGNWMGLNVPWGKYGIHGTTKPGSIGWPSSHGCIRMYNKDVEELYGIVPHGTRVVIVNGSFGPFGSGFKNIEPGDRGADVMEVQRRLLDLGYYNAYVDGIYGEGMKYAVHKFQKENGLVVKNAVTKKDLEFMGFLEFE